MSSRLGAWRRDVLVATALLVWLGAAGVVPVAWAHAQLVRSDPAARAVLPVAPARVDLTLSEAITPEFSTMEVLDRARNVVSVAPLSQPAGNTSLRVGLQPGLRNGTYTVLWRVVSAVDGHVTQGNFAFIVQAAGGPIETPGPALTPVAGGGTPSDEDESSPPPPAGRWLARALALIAAAGLLGGALFSSLVIGAGLPAEVASLAGPLGRRLAGWVAVLGAVLALALGADMVYQIGALRGIGPLEALGHLDVAPKVVTTTGYGQYWALRAAAALGLVVYGLWRRSRPARADWTPAVLGGGLVVAGEALASHGAAAPNIAGLPLGMLSDGLHLLATAAWIGGLLYLAVVLLPVLRRAEPQAAAGVLAWLVPRFSNLALASVGVLVVTGVFNLSIHSLDPGAVAASDYGRVLVIKHLLFLPLLTLGAANNRVMRPRLIAALRPGAPESGGLAARFGRLVGAEAVLGAGVVLLAAGLTLLPPPAAAEDGSAALPEPVAVVTPLPAAGPSAATATPVVAVFSQTVNGVRFGLEVRPSPQGDQFVLDITRVEEATAPLTDVLKLQVRAIPQDIDSGTSSLPVSRVGPADADRQVYTATGQVLTLAGAYQLNAELQRTEGDDLRAGFRLNLDENGGLTVAAADVLQALLTTRPSPPITGTATISIRVIDGRRQPVTDATVQLLPVMPAHAHVEPLSAATPVAGSPGVYETRANFTMGGAWLLIVEVDRPGQPPAKIDASLDVTDPFATPKPGTPAPPP
ncbi:MAG TPA: copper resistance protein CopC [Chloroflexia bacterium]|nr:copper resistance protein CopC [Chloroflexia bacterium]